MCTRSDISEVPETGACVHYTIYKHIQMVCAMRNKQSAHKTNNEFSVYLGNNHKIYVYFICVMLCIVYI